jgi:hypothetical protein
MRVRLGRQVVERRRHAIVDGEEKQLRRLLAAR